MKKFKNAILRLCSMIVIALVSVASVICFAPQKSSIGGGINKNNEVVDNLTDDTDNGGNKINNNTNNSSTNVGVNNNTNNGASTNVGVNKITPQTFNFKSDEINISKGSGEINFSYTPDNNTRATSTAYQYRFNNSMKVDMAVNLKSISTTSVTLSYAYSDTALDTISSTSNIFECQRISSNASKYIYIVVTPTSTSIPSTFSSSVVFYQGEAGTLDIISNGEILSTQTIVKGQMVNEPVIEVEEGYELQGLYLDEACTMEVTFPIRLQGISLYPKVITIRDSVVYALNGTVDSEGYTLYGAYPQDYVGNTLNTTLKDALSAGTLKETTWTYTTDINGKTTTLTEYEYEGNYYAYLPSARAYDNNNNFDDGTAVSTGSAYFFEVLPLQWVNHNGTFLCEKIIGSRWFGPYDSSTSTYTLLWKDSPLRTWLNEIFYIESGISLVKKNTTTIPNNSASGETDAYNGTPTEDYMWLPSYQEMTTWYSSDDERIKYNTDFNDATYGISWGEGDGTYWTRSAASTAPVYGVHTRGDVDPDLPYYPTFGVCPAFTL